MTIRDDQKQLISDLVHQALCEVMGDPAGGCAWYALLGAFGIKMLTGKTYGVFAGSLKLWIAPDSGDGLGDYYLEHDCTSGLPGEFHAWIALPDDRTRTYLEWVDLSARHYKDWVDAGGLPWERDPVGEFLWTDTEGLHGSGVWLYPDRRLTEHLIDTLLGDPRFLAARDRLRDLIRPHMARFSHKKPEGFGR